MSSPLYYPGPNSLLLYANTHVNTWDIAIAYAITTRLDLTLDIPVQYGTRAAYYEHDLLHLHTMRAAGLSDMRLSGNFWLLEPERHPHENISIGLGVQIPTGDADAKDYSYRATGPVLRPVDPAIQLGTGSWGLLVSGQAFAKIFTNTFGYAQGTYLIQARESNGTQTPFGDEPALTGGFFGYIYDSVPDQYLARAGITYGVTPLARPAQLFLSLGARVEGVPVRDLIGGSEGYRIPGYAVSIEPGVSVVSGRYLFSLTAPVAVERHASTSVTDARTHSPVAGYAAFADFTLQVSASVRF